MGDGNFKWWVGQGAEPEAYHGPFETRDIAIQTGRSDYQDTGFTICESDKSVMRPEINLDFYVEQILESLIEANEECFSDDYPDLDQIWNDEDLKALDTAFQQAITTWLIAHPGTTWAFGTMRNVKYFIGEPEGEGGSHV